MEVKLCRKCGVEYPLTKEFWYPNTWAKRPNQKFKAPCRACKNNRHREYIRKRPSCDEIDLPEESRACTQCGKSYPATDEHFTRNRSGRNGLEARCKSCFAEYMRKKREEDPGRFREYSRRAYQNNQDWVIAYRNRPDVKERHVAEVAEWRRRNPEKYKEQSRRRSYRRRQIIRSYEGDVMTKEQWQMILENQEYTCLSCNRSFAVELPATVDHIVPVSRGGSLAASNVQALCGPCNSSKRDQTIDYRKPMLIGASFLVGVLGTGTGWPPPPPGPTPEVML